MDVTFFNPFADVVRHKNHLPHWQQPGATYFLTYRLADSIPQPVLDRWLLARDIFLNANPQPWTAEQAAEFEQRFQAVLDEHLDELHGACVLRQRELAETAAAVLRTFDGERYHLHAWVIMPNHVHVLFTLRNDRMLEDEVKAWKGVAARRINAMLSRRGDFWQRDYFDRMIRDAAHFWRCARYIQRNPDVCGLRAGEFLSGMSDTVRQVLSHPDGWR